MKLAFETNDFLLQIHPTFQNKEGVHNITFTTVEEGKKTYETFILPYAEAITFLINLFDQVYYRNNKAYATPELLELLSKKAPKVYARIVPL